MPEKIKALLIDQLVEFETAKLAKEKGFGKGRNVICETMYTDDGLQTEPPYIEKLLTTPTILAPTQSLLQAWLRDEHDIWVTVETWKFVLRDKDHIIHYQICCDDSLIPKTKLGNKMIDGFGDSYEKALEAGLQQALKLIK